MVALSEKTEKDVGLGVKFVSTIMGIFDNLKMKTGKFFLEREGETKRRRKGFNFSVANQVAILYKDEGPDMFARIKSYVKYLHEEHGVRKVFAFGFVDASNNHVPSYQLHKLEFDYFTKDDLNWHLKPSSVVKRFTELDFDILIDLTTEDCVPLNYILAHSKAKMKVGRRGTSHESMLDLLIDLEDNDGLDRFIDQVNFYLSNFAIQ